MLASMRTIGLLGGMSWESSAEYYRLLNEEVRARLGGHHCARVVLVSLDFADIRGMQRRDAWNEAGGVLADAARAAQDAGADVLLLCTNLMHKVAADLVEAVTVPFLHIVDVVGERIAAAGLGRVGLLGARATMEDPFYRSRLRERYGIEVVVPGEPDRSLVDEVVFNELTRGRVEETSRRAYERIIAGLADRGAEGVILGCTEISLLVGRENSPVPVFDSTSIHAEAGVEYALSADPYAGRTGFIAR